MTNEYSPSNTFEYKLIVEGHEIQLGPKDLTISISDSIFTFAPAALIEAEDTYGIWTQSRISTPGVNCKLIIGMKEKAIEFDGTFNFFEMPQTEGSALHGYFKASLVHRLSFTERFNAVYSSSSPTDIYKRLLNDENIKTVKTSSKCVSYEKIYNPFLNKKEFTEDILVHLATSDDSSIDPYYAFIDSEGTGHFESLSEMSSQQDIATILYCKTKPEEMPEAINAITILPFSEKLMNMEKDLNKKYFYYKDYEIKETERDYLAEGIPVLTEKHQSKISSKMFNCFVDPKIEMAEMNYKMRQKILSDKVMITIPMNISVHAGSVINIKSYLNFEEATEAASYSGKYLVESSQHQWNSSNMAMITTCIASRMKTIK